jgi:hypothetical protein
MPFYQPPQQPTFASLLRSFAQHPGLPFTETLSEELINRIAAEEGVDFGNQADAVYTPAVTLWAFLTQCLSDSKSCVAAVARVIVLCVSLGRSPCSAATGAYCLARAKLPVPFLRRLTYELGQSLEAQAEPSWLWHRRHVKLVDGTCLSAPDTAANQALYPQPKSQRPGLGFPLIRLVVLLTFATAALVGAAYGPVKGKESGETALFRTLLVQLQRGDVLVADRYFCSYWMIALLQQRGVDAVFRLHQRRHCDFRRGRRLGRYDHVVQWPKPTRPDWMAQAIYESLPDELTLREVRVTVQTPGVRVRTLVVVTTLLDAKEYGREDIADLYHRRWHVELDIRSIKQTLGMDVLTCKTPKMLERELWVHLLGYNLVRQVQVQTALAQKRQPRQLSFAGTVQTLNAFRWLLQCSEGERLQFACRVLYLAVATHRVGDRPNRVEPRRLKRRKQKYPYLRVPRVQARAALLADGVQE